MKKTVFFGAGLCGEKAYDLFKDEFDVICFIDNSVSKQGTNFCGLPVYPPDKLADIEFDRLFITAILDIDGMHSQLLSLGVDDKKIHDDFYLLFSKSRELCLNRIAETVYEYNLPGQVAEAGVYKGSFSKIINRNFPDRIVHLFDTFDFAGNNFEELKRKLLNESRYPQNYVIHKGFFPNTAKDLDETFCFVSVDMSVYDANLNALIYFYPRLVEQGIILIHDYFCEKVGVKQIVADYGKMIGQRLKIVPIGDDYSIAIVK